ncbi:hypothetical protein POJ06DRAFT_262504, partial [Lipomyces tetrasporus]
MMSHLSLTHVCAMVRMTTMMLARLCLQSSSSILLLLMQWQLMLRLMLLHTCPTKVLWTNLYLSQILMEFMKWV